MTGILYLLVSHADSAVGKGCLAYLLQIWVSSPHNASGYYGLKEEINDALSKEHFQAILAGAGDTSVQYARTGYLGFMIKAEDNAKSKGTFVRFHFVPSRNAYLGFVCSWYVYVVSFLLLLSITGGECSL